MEISKVFTEMKIDVKTMNVRTNKQGIGTIETGFVVHGREELTRVTEKLRQLPEIMDIERTAG